MTLHSLETESGRVEIKKQTAIKDVSTTDNVRKFSSILLKSVQLDASSNISVLLRSVKKRGIAKFNNEAIAHPRRIVRQTNYSLLTKTTPCSSTHPTREISPLAISISSPRSEVDI